MIFAILMYVGLVLLALKALWNLTIPYRLALRPYNEATGATNPISFEVGFDLLFLVWSLLFIPFSDDAYLFCSKLCIAITCVALPVATFIHFMVAGFFCGWIKATFTPKKPKKEKRSDTMY